MDFVIQGNITKHQFCRFGKGLPLLSFCNYTISNSKKVSAVIKGNFIHGSDILQKSIF